MSTPAPLPANESTRLAALRALAVLDSPSESLFDTLASTAAALCDAPIALVSLVDGDRQWFKAMVGIDGIRETPRDFAFCAHVVANDELIEVTDATKDARFHDNPFVVGPPNIQYYAGAPIRLSDGHTLGTVCVIDHAPRKLAEHQLQALVYLAQLAARGFETRAAAAGALRLASQASEDLARSREFLQTTLESISEAVITTGPTARIQWMNPAAELTTGWTFIEAEGQHITKVFALVDEKSGSTVPSPVEFCIDTERQVDLVDHTTLISRDGLECSVECSASPIRDADARVLGSVLTFRDVSEQRRHITEMSHRALHDELTGLPNRTAFATRVANLIAACTQVEASHAMLYIDLDQFKVVNDACGHAAGDQLLRQISGIVRDCIRSHDTLARLGGDEFGVLLEHCDVARGQLVAQKICDHMEEFRFVYEGRRFRVGASIGLVPLDARWPTVTSLLQVADASCYAAKEEGRNRVHVWVDSDTALEARQGDMHWVSRIELALDENRFELHGQRIAPIVEDGRGLHLEVLLRMREPSGPLILPNGFLPVAERFHLATRIDRWVVRKSFEWMAHAKRSGTEIELLSINLSGQSLVDRAFQRDIVEMVRAADFDVHHLCFEITETAAITHLTEARRFIEELRALGVKIALDDFGAGASSFGYLKSLPVDFLKIDGHFVTNILDDEIDKAAVRCFCDVAKVCGITTIAEFVGSDAVREELRVIGVDMAQGYLIHRPEALSALLGKMTAADGAFVDPQVSAVVREIAVDVQNPNRLDLENVADVLLWADDLGIEADALREIVAKVGPMRAAIRFYVDRSRPPMAA